MRPLARPRPRLAVDNSRRLDIEARIAAAHHGYADAAARREAAQRDALRALMELAQARGDLADLEREAPRGA